MSEQNELTARQRQTLNARTALAQKLSNREERTQYYSAIARKRHEGSISLSVEEAKAIVSIAAKVNKNGGAS
jgi:hypothetical protein